MICTILESGNGVMVCLLYGTKPSLNTLRPRQNGCQFPDDILKCISLNENIQTSIKISLKFVPKGPINNILTLVQIMAWHRPGDKPSSEQMMVSLWRIYELNQRWLLIVLANFCQLFIKIKISYRKMDVNIYEMWTILFRTHHINTQYLVNDGPRHPMS